MQLSIKADIKAAEKALGALKKQVPFAAWLAQKNTAFSIRRKVQNHMRGVFKTASRYTMQAPIVDYQNYTQYRDKEEKTMAVDLISQFKGKSGNRERSRHYLWDHIHGQRTHTGFERLLIDAGIMPSDRYAVRTKYLHLFSGGGKISKGIYNKIISQLRAFKTGRGHDINATNSAKSKRKRKRRTGQVIYVMNIGGTFGIWMHYRKFTGNGLIPLFIFVKRAEYKKIFRFYEVSQAHANRVWPIEFKKAISHAIKTAK